MIFVDRGEEPEELANERSRKLAAVAIGKARDLTKYDPQEVKNKLYKQQGHCCAYCGGMFEPEGNPLDHFRPKSGADDVNWTVLPDEPHDPTKFLDWFDTNLSHERRERANTQSSPWIRNPNLYWWLTWTWENLVFACVTCNSQTHKGNRFPLKRGTRALLEHEQPPAQEQPLLVDPSRSDPLDHIRFAPDTTNGWGPIPRTQQGRWTIAVLGLHQRPTLRDRWRDCAANIIKNESFVSFFNGVHQLSQSERERQWQSLTDEQLYRRSEYRALRWCVFDYELRSRRLASLGLPLPRPWHVRTIPTRPVWTDRPEIGRFPHHLQMRIRALRPRLDGDAEKRELLEVIVELCSHGPLTAQELGAITERKSPRYLENEYLQPLTSGPSPRLAYDARIDAYRRL